MVGEPGKQKVSAALRLLQGIASELRNLAEDTARFGETLSRDATIARTSETVGLLQKFDLFSQSLKGHAHLIGNLSQHIDGDTDDLSALHDLIGDIPFFGIRERLRAKLAGADRQLEERCEEPVDENWL